MPNWESNCYYYEDEDSELDGFMECPFCGKVGLMRNVTENDAISIARWHKGCHSQLF